MTHESPSIWASWITRATNAASRIESLPAVACADWCDQAASRLNALPDVVAAFIVLGRAGGMGQQIELDAVGVSSQPATSGRPVLSDSEQLSLRSRLEGLASSGRLTLRAPLLGAPDLWNDAPGTTSLQAWSRVGSGDRVLIAQLATTPTEGGAEAPLTAVLDSLTPLLARRALIAVGSGDGAPTWLTSREQLVLDQLILGNSVREIAGQIGRSPHTVHDHVKNLHRKLGASSRGELVARALGRGRDVDRELVAQSPSPVGAARGAEGSFDRHVEPKPALTRSHVGPS